MRIAIDLNDVIRDYTNAFIKNYKKAFPNVPDVDEIEITSPNFFDIFPFTNEHAYHQFIYEDYPLEIYGHADAMEKDLPARFNDWMFKTLRNIDVDDVIDVAFVSPMEYELSIQSTYFFLSKIGSRVREVIFPKDSFSIWNNCDVLITANPKLINSKPDCENQKTCIKISTTYNQEDIADYTYDSLMEFIGDENNILNLLE